MLQTKWANKRKWIMMGLAAVLILSMLSGCGKKTDKAVSSVVATYKGGQVTQQEFDVYKGVLAFLDPQMQQAVGEATIQERLLDQLIGFKILESQASDKVKTDTKPKVKTQMDQFSALFTTDAAKKSRDDQLKTLGITLDDVQKYVERSMIVMDEYKSKVTDEQIKSQYDQNVKSDPYYYVNASVRHILIALQGRTKDAALARAKEVRDKLEKGGDFTALAKEYSDDPGSKDKGGLYENVDVMNWVPGFKEAAATLPINEISQPVETTYGYHIIKVESRTTKALADVKDDLSTQIASGNINDYITKTLPPLIEKVSLPTPSPTPAASGALAASAAPTPAAASPSPTK